jgi:hypothetical protein
MDEIESYVRSYLLVAVLAYLGFLWFRSVYDEGTHLAYRNGLSDAFAEALEAGLPDDQVDDQGKE